MAKAILVSATAITAALAVLLAIFLWNAANRAALVGPDGYTDIGARLGVRVGTARQQATAAFRRLGFTPYGDQTGGMCLSHSYGNDTRVEILADDSWRHGTICVASKHNRIIALETRFMVTPVF